MSFKTTETDKTNETETGIGNDIEGLKTIVDQETKTDDECKNEISEFFNKSGSKFFHAIALGAISSAIGVDTARYKVGQTAVTSGDIAKNFALGTGWGAVTGTIAQATDIRVAGGIVTSAISGGVAHGLKYAGRAKYDDEGENWADFLIIMGSLLLELLLSVIMPFVKKCCNKRTGPVGDEKNVTLHRNNE